MVVGRLLSYWEGNFSGAMLNFRRVSPENEWLEDETSFQKIFKNGPFSADMLIFRGVAFFLTAMAILGNGFLKS